jgi:hypothetical protein
MRDVSDDAAYADLVAAVDEAIEILLELRARRMGFID